MRYAAKCIDDHGTRLADSNVPGKHLCNSYSTVALTCARSLLRLARDAQLDVWCTYMANAIYDSLQCDSLQCKTQRRSEMVTHVVALLRTTAMSLYHYAPWNVDLAQMACSAVLVPHVLKMVCMQQCNAHTVDLYTLATVAAWYE